MNKTDLEILREQTLFNQYSKEIFEIVNEDFNKNQRVKYGSCFSTAVDSFSYGVIIGQRLERAKRKEKKNGKK